MRQNMMRRKLAAAFAALIVAFGMPASAQQYPNKPIRLVVPYAPGGPTDILARIVALKMTDAMGVSVIVDNKPGAASIIATELVAKAPADGYSLLVGSPGLASNLSLYKKLPYDTLKDLSPVTAIASTPYFLIVNAALPVRDVKELIALAKAKPDAIAYASSGSGGPPHLISEMFNSMAGVKMLHVPYKGTSPAVVDLVSGQVQVLFSGLPTTRGFISEGKLRVLGVADPKRSVFLPDVPTISEAGVPGFSGESWFGFFARTGTPKEVEEQINIVMQKILETPEVREKFADVGAVPMSTTAAQFKAFFGAEVEKWAKVIRASGATAEQ
jgi:tripartite-type tricarboxylate transporter receptor subunit TctC